MTTHRIDIEGLPKGWELVKVNGEAEKGYLDDEGNRHMMAEIILQKSKPRRIVIEETGEYNKTDRHGDLHDQQLGHGIVISSEMIWRIKEEC